MWYSVGAALQTETEGDVSSWNSVLPPGVSGRHGPHTRVAPTPTRRGKLGIYSATSLAVGTPPPTFCLFLPQAESKPSTGRPRAGDRILRVVCREGRGERTWVGLPAASVPDPWLILILIPARRGDNSYCRCFRGACSVPSSVSTSLCELTQPSCDPRICRWGGQDSP